MREEDKDEGWRKMSNNKGKIRIPISVLVRVASVAVAVRFGWALQLSLLTPYVQELGIPHVWASLVGMCGPISGILVQPIVGHYSDGCTSKYGRRRPFIVVGAISVVVGVLTIGFSADLGFLLGDSLVGRPRAIVFFVLGFWILDVGSGVIQVPSRALLVDFTGKDQKRTQKANAYYSSLLAIGTILGYATGAYGGWWKLFPFSVTTACNVACANLKSAFLIGIVVVAFTTFLSVTAASEIPYFRLPRYGSKKDAAFTPLLADRQCSSSDPEVGKSTTIVSGTVRNSDGEEEANEKEDLAHLQSEGMPLEFLRALRDLPRPMWYILLVTALTWMAIYPFLLFDTDWMGREVYMGEPSSSDPLVTKRYFDGVHMGSLGLVLHSIVIALFSLCIGYLCDKLGSTYLWGLSNMVLATVFGATVLITAISKRTATTATEEGAPPPFVTLAALAILALFGVPLAVTTTVPYSLAATFTENVGGGQGLSMGVLTLVVSVPQFLVSLGAGPLDEIFGGGNMPAFYFGAGIAICGAVAAVLLLRMPPPPPDSRTFNRVLLGDSSLIP
jgi:solute carrier family 45 protein 1/2/4